VNIGDTYLTNVVVTDNVLGVIGTIVGTLNPGQTNRLYATNLNVAVDVVNVAVASGNPQPVGGEANLPQVFSTDTAEVRMTPKAEWLDPNWPYRMPITICSTSNLSDYPVKLLVDAMSGMRSDFGDIRFTQSDGTNPISYWMDCQVDATNAVFWIRVPSVQTTCTVVYIYYGNTNSTTISSGADTFSVFEGFEDKPTGQNPVSGWKEIGTQNGDFTVVNDPSRCQKSGYLNQWGTCPCPQGRYRVYKGIGTHSANFAWDFYAKAPRNDRKVLMELTDEVNQKLTVTLKFGENGYIGYNSAGIWYNIMPYDPNTWYEFSVINVNFAASQYDLMINGVVVGTNLGFYQSASRITHMTLVGDCAYPGAAWFDDIRIRNYAGEYPTSAFGDPETRIYAVLVETDYGTAEPAAGSHGYLEGVTLTNRLNGSSEIHGGATQYICAGWSLLGHSATNGENSGTETQVVITVTNRATLRWLWQTNCWLNADAGLHGSVDATNGWYTNGAAVTIWAQADLYYHFTNWIGTVTGSAVWGNPLSLRMDGSKSNRALFAENVVTNSTPEWWLAGYGLTNEGRSFSEAAMWDADGDGAPSWEEYWANTDPRNPLSVFKVQAVNPTDSAAYVVNWAGGSDRVYSIFFSTNYAVDGWSNLATGLSLPAGSYTDTVNGTSSIIWYRGGVRKPKFP
jgi:hypothetical protein